jgi:hypothetical protein
VGAIDSNMDDADFDDFDLWWSRWLRSGVATDECYSHH